MQTVIHRADTRGYYNHGWLQTHHSFSFAAYQNPERMRFGLLRVLNDDRVEPGQGFGTHGHDNMEIVTIPLSGTVAHRDSTGGEGTIQPGEIQIMSAGSGLTHSEFNASDTEALHLLQIWVFPKEMNIPPRYNQKMFSEEELSNSLRTIVSPDAVDGSLQIHQDARFSLGTLEAGTNISYLILQEGNGAYLFVIDGTVEAAGESLQKRDAIGISEAAHIELTATSQAKLVVIDVPMHA